VARLAPHELDKQPASRCVRWGNRQSIGHMQPSRSTSRLESIMGEIRFQGCGDNQADHGSDHHDTERQRYRLNKSLHGEPARLKPKGPPPTRQFAAGPGTRSAQPVSSVQCSRIGNSNPCSIRSRLRSVRQASRRSSMAAKNPMHQGPARTVPSSVRSKIGA